MLDRETTKLFMNYSKPLHSLRGKFCNLNKINYPFSHVFINFFLSKKSEDFAYFILMAFYMQCAIKQIKLQQNALMSFNI